MAQIVSGLTTGTPSAELIFSNILIGSVLKFLYGLTDRVNWYTLYLFGAHFLALTGLLWAFLRLQPSRTAAILFALLFVEFEVALLLRLQFTSTAILAAVSGIVLTLSRDETSGRRSMLATCCGAALVILAGLIRPDAMYYAIVLLLPLFAYEALFFRRWRPFVVIGLSVVAVATASALDGWHYRSDPAWREFMAYNRARLSSTICRSSRTSTTRDSSSTALAGATPIGECSRTGSSPIARRFPARSSRPFCIVSREAPGAGRNRRNIWPTACGP